MKQKPLSLSSEHLTELLKSYIPLEFTRDQVLVYSRQIPPAAFILISGGLLLASKEEDIVFNTPGDTIGLYHVLHSVKTKTDCYVLANSRVIMLGKSEILQALNDKESKLYSIIKEVV